MRFIKLSHDDIDFPDRDSVDVFFNSSLPENRPAGKFLITKGRIGESGLEVGELLVFSYKTKVTHLAKAASGRLENFGNDKFDYPYYFLVDMDTVKISKDIGLAEVERILDEVGIVKTLVNTQSWPKLADSKLLEQIWEGLIV